MQNPEVWGYRIHQWSKADHGVSGESVAIGMKKKENHEAKMVWAAHCEEEISNWEVFLPTLYSLYKVVANTDYNLYADLSIEKAGNKVRYKYINP